ncbi:MAG: SirB2 family protein [Chitinophagales bacterium]
MESALKHVHYVFVVLFLISYFIKSTLFLLGKNEAFASYKKKSILTETLFAVGFLITGIAMIIQNQNIFDGAWLKNSGWFHIKLTLVILAIPLGIIGFKKSNKLLVLISVLFFLYVLLLALPATRNTFMIF